MLHRIADEKTKFVLSFVIDFEIGIIWAGLLGFYHILNLGHILKNLCSELWFVAFWESQTTSEGLSKGSCEKQSYCQLLGSDYKQYSNDFSG